MSDGKSIKVIIEIKSPIIPEPEDPTITPEPDDNNDTKPEDPTTTPDTPNDNTNTSENTQ